MNLNVLTKKEIEVLKILTIYNEKYFETNMLEIQRRCNIKSATQVHAVLKLLRFAEIIETHSMGMLGSQVKIIDMNRWKELREFVAEGN